MRTLIIRLKQGRHATYRSICYSSAVVCLYLTDDEQGRFLSLVFLLPRWYPAGYTTYGKALAPSTTTPPQVHDIVSQGGGSQGAPSAKDLVMPPDAGATLPRYLDFEALYLRQTLRAPSYRCAASPFIQPHRALPPPASAIRSS